MSLIGKLKREHKVLVQLLEEIRELGPNHLQSAEKISIIKLALLQHVEHEDEELYSSLNEASQNDEAIETTFLKMFKEMEVASTQAIGLLSKYQQGGDQVQFAEDMSEIFKILGTRIWREEDSLYPLFEKLPKKA